MLSIGLMSGTSMDGIDSAILETDGSEKCIRALGHTFLPYEASFKILLKAAEYAVKKQEGVMMENAQAYYEQGIREYLSVELGMDPLAIQSKIQDLSASLHGSEKENHPITLKEVIHHSTFLHSVSIKRLLEATGYKAEQIDVIGYHGQAMFHRPSHKISIIVGEGQYLAEQLGITVVTDFRKNDVLSGGHGAPFAPLYHQALAIRDQKGPVVVVNCGGIANITLITGAREKDLSAFDTGPGNGLIDRLIRQRTHGRESMDKDGYYGKQGKVNEKVLKALYEKSILKEGQNYFLNPPPKSLDSGDMTLIPELEVLSLEDACATLEAFTADTIVESLDLIKKEIPKTWILAGGGWNNPVIRRELETRLRKKFGTSVHILTADEAGWSGQGMEAELFAYLAVRSLQNKPLSLPSTTGVPRPLSGGCVYVPSTGATEVVKKMLQ